MEPRFSWETSRHPPRVERLRTSTKSRAARIARTKPVGPALVLLLGLCLATIARADSELPISIETLVPFAEKSEIRDSIRQDCGLSTKLSRAIAERGESRGITLERVGNLAEQGGDRTLGLRITDAIKASGGVFPTTSLSIDGVLKSEGKVVGTFVATRFARASLIPFARSECAILSIAVNSLAKDVVKWLKAPRLDSRLGDAR